MHTLLKLQHHRHTAKRLPHRHTSYRGLAVIALVFALSLTLIQRTTAATLDVTAKNPAPIPSTAPIIGSHTDGNVVDSKTIIISGTCEVLTPAYSVIVFNSNQFIGSTACEVDGTFSVTVVINDGTNSITVGSRTITDDPGPVSQPIRILYGTTVIEEPVVPETEPETSVTTPARDSPKTPSRGGLAASESSPPKITFGESTYIIYSPNQVVQLNYELSGGAAPYRVSINWGDGSAIEESTVNSAGKYSAQHSYQVLGTFTATVSLIDSKDQKTQTSIAALTFARPTLAVSSNTTQPTGITANLVSDKLFVYAWSAYGIVALSIITFWFGEVHLAPKPAPVRVRAVPHRRVRH